MPPEAAQPALTTQDLRTAEGSEESRSAGTFVAQFLSSGCLDIGITGRHLANDRHVDTKQVWLISFRWRSL